MGSFWHSFADMAALDAGEELVVDRGEGTYIWDEDDRRYLDATAGLWYCNVGYGREEIGDAVAASSASWRPTRRSATSRTDQRSS
ncbi:MAG: aminotransferase class III-fold pyridoxal phosphate-dependent enzyme [Actinomycetota bacterium]